MDESLHELHYNSLQLYMKYKLNKLTQKEYLLQIKFLDDKIDSLEVSILSCHLQGNPASEISSLKQLH